ncbi:MAG TPA: porin family protein [Saprospiraceae bacterium]|nr:porin family protein [Saprospiraceae bacterium]
MKLKITITTFLALALTFSLSAQLRYGFKTGLNFARIDGPSETSAAGGNLENWKNVTGFHIGMSLGYNFSDNYGVRGELLYSKKGAKYEFKGPSYRIFRYDGGSTYTTGNSTFLININNSYLDLPVMGYARWGDFELSAGVYASLLIGSYGTGSLTYENAKTDPLGNAVDRVQFNLDYNYRKDKPGEGESGQTVVVKVDSRTLELPKQLGAYYDYPEDKGSLFNAADYGLIGGASYFFSRSLYLGARLQYGLADLTNNDADLAKGSTNADKSLIYRADKDRNFNVQVSVGFSF